MMTKLIVLAGFVVAFSAGLVTGLHDQQLMSAAQPTTNPDHHPGGPPRRGLLPAELNLTPDQQEKMKDIWSEVAGHGGRERDERRHQCREDRDTAIASLVHPEDMGSYDQILKKYNDQLAGIDQEMHDSFDAAVAKTKLILTPEQRAKYEAFLAKNQWDRRPPDENNRRPGDRATTRPASDK